MISASASNPRAKDAAAPSFVRRAFISVAILCFFQQLAMLNQYSKDSLLFPMNDEPLSSPQDTTRRTHLGHEYAKEETIIPKWASKKERETSDRDSDQSRQQFKGAIVGDTNDTIAKTRSSDTSPVFSIDQDKGVYNEDVERALVVICLGESALLSNYVERFVWSARQIGNFTGWIVLLTDAPNDRYSHLSANEWGGIDNEKFSILRPEERHFIRDYKKGPAMVYKQFKAYVLEYLSQDSRLDNVQLVYYLDVDIVFGNSIWPLFHDLEEKYKIGQPATHKDERSSIANMWMFYGNSHRAKIQGGQMILDRRTSQPCLTRFQSLMDPETSTIDQVHLTQMMRDQLKARKTGKFSSLECEIVVMPQEEKYIVFPNKTVIQDIAAGNFDSEHLVPILNHLKNTGGDLKSSSPEEIEAYLRYLFRFKDDQEDTLGITRKAYLDEGKRSKETKKKRNNDVTTERKRKAIRESKNAKPTPLETTDINQNGSINGGLDKHEHQSAESYKEMKQKSSYGIERAMFVISMGKRAAEMTTVERFIYSARNAGQYNGWIIVLTDAPKDRYTSIANWTQNVIIMEPKPEDVKTDYKVSNMIYKRFKTFAVDYMDRDPRLDNVEVVYYLDVDIVFGNNMEDAFYGLETKYGIGRLGANSTNHKNSIARGKMWMFKGNSDKWQIQGGQMILERPGSQPCLERWRKGFDQEKVREYAKDQYLLMAMKAEQEEAYKSISDHSSSTNHSHLECEIFTMEQSPYIEFPLVKNIKRRSQAIRKNKESFEYSPMVHVRNDGGTAGMKNGNIRPFMSDLLRFKEGQEDPLKLLKKVRMDTS